VSLASILQPLATFRGSALKVELIKVLELAGLGNVLLVVGVDLGLVGGTDLSVLVGGQTSGDVRAVSNRAHLGLWRKRP
jgi:hypothetical protein